MTMLMGYPGPPMVPPLIGPALPRRGEPGWTMLPRRVWPISPLAAAPHRVVVLAVAAGLLGTAESRPTRTEWAGIALTLALLAVPALLAADWLGVLCIMAAWIEGGARCSADAPGPRS